MENKDIEKAIERFFVEREGEGVSDIIRDIDFIEEGILDSLDLVSLAAFIESNLGKKIGYVTLGKKLPVFNNSNAIADVS